MKPFLRNAAFAIPAIALVLLFAGCKEKGCTDEIAYNYESFADIDDGSCKFSTVMFKLNESSFGYDSVVNSSTLLFLDGASIGSITRSGTREFELQKGTTQKYLAESTVYDHRGNVYTRIDSGMITANPTQQTLEVNLFK